MPFPLQNSFGKGTLIRREDEFSPKEQINTSQGMMMMLNCEDAADDNMVVDEENTGYVEGDDEDDEEDEESERRARIADDRKKGFRGIERPSEVLRLNAR